MRLGELLLAAGVVKEADLRRVLRRQRRLARPLGRLLVEHGCVSEGELLRALSTQLHMPVVRLDRLEIPPHLVTLVPPGFLRRAGVLPFELQHRVLHVAVAAPVSEALRAELHAVFRMDVAFHLAAPTALERTFDRLLPPVGPKKREPPGPP